MAVCGPEDKKPWVLSLPAWVPTPAWKVELSVGQRICSVVKRTGLMVKSKCVI